MRFLPHSAEDRKAMLQAVGVASFDDLVSTIPASLRLRGDLDLPRALSEMELADRMSALAAKNASCATTRSFLAAGAYDHFVPHAVDHLLSRTEFYSSYTPYQPEISQGTLQTIYEFQSMICMLTALDVSNASLYEGASALVEAIPYELFNVVTGQQLLAERVETTDKTARATAHRVADRIFERLTGIPGAFSTRIAYVSAEGAPPKQRYKLIVADADGFNPRVIGDSPEPIMSPAWSPDGRSLAYVSFEGKVSAIYVQILATGERRRVSARAGINGAPAWSQDGRRLALTLSRNGNLDIYVLDLGTQALTRITSDEAIDTEREWGKGDVNYFTSDRAGGPQVYQVAMGEDFLSTVEY